MTGDRKTCRRSYQRAKKFWGGFSSQVLELTPQTHDRFVGEVSHLPHAMAACLVRTVSVPALQVASTGFYDTTRIAAAASSIWQPIFSANRKVMLDVLSRFEGELRTFKKILQDRDPKKLVRFLDQAQKKRQKL